MLPVQMPVGTAELVVLRDNGWPIGEAAVAWAVAALTAGVESPSLRVLAGLDLDGPARSFEVLPLIALVLAELSIPVPDRDVAARQYVREVAEAVVAGRMSPDRAADLIHSRVIEPLNHPDDLMAWCYLWEGNAPDLSRALDERERESAIVQHAAAVVRSHPDPPLQPTPPSRPGGTPRR